MNLSGRLDGEIHDIGHAIEAGRLVHEPLRGADGSGTVNAAIGRFVGEFDTLARAGENCAVLAWHITALGGRQSDGAILPGPGMAVPGGGGGCIAAEATSRGGRFR